MDSPISTGTARLGILEKADAALQRRVCGWEVMDAKPTPSNKTGAGGEGAPRERKRRGSRSSGRRGSTAGISAMVAVKSAATKLKVRAETKKKMTRVISCPTHPHFCRLRSQSLPRCLQCCKLRFPRCTPGISACYVIPLLPLGAPNCPFLIYYSVRVRMLLATLIEMSLLVYTSTAACSCLIAPPPPTLDVW